MSTPLLRLLATGVFLCAPSCAQDSPLKAYLGLTDAQSLQMNRVRKAEFQEQFGQPSPGGTAARQGRVDSYANRPVPQLQSEISAAIKILTDTQKAKLLALEEALQLEAARLGAISLQLIDSPGETSGCSCDSEDTFARRLALTDPQRSELRRRTPAERLSVLTPDQRAKFETLRARPDLLDAADEGARLRLIPDPVPRYECLCN